MEQLSSMESSRRWNYLILEVPRNLTAKTELCDGFFFVSLSCRKIFSVLLLSAWLVSCSNFASSLYTRLILLSLPYLSLLSHHVHSTFVCPTEILAFSDRVNEFTAINTEVVACSVDSKFTHFAWINTPREEGGLKGLKIPLLSDLTKQISKDYGVLLENEGHTLRLAI